jgi:hypothetical protein
MLITQSNGSAPDRQLLMIADGDIVRPEHAVEMFRLLPHAQLAILPGTDHMPLVKIRPTKRQYAAARPGSRK